MFHVMCFMIKLWHLNFELKYDQTKINNQIQKWFHPPLRHLTNGDFTATCCLYDQFYSH